MLSQSSYCIKTFHRLFHRLSPLLELRLHVSHIRSLFVLHLILPSNSMASPWLSQFCRVVRAPDTAERYRNAIGGILLVPLIQLVVVPIQMALDSRGMSLPASILVMTVVTVVMLLIDSIHGGLSSFYSTYMKGPTDFLGRHMSFGFVASFVMLSKDHIQTAMDIPKIVGAFAFTTLLSYIGSFLMAAGCFKLEERIRGLWGLRRRAEDPEYLAEPKKPSSRYAKRASQVSKLADIIVNNGSLTSVETLCSPSITVQFIVQTAPLWISVFLLVTVGIPVYCATKYDMPFETFVFIFFWIGAVKFQRFVKTCRAFALRSRIQSTLVVILNPVLVASALGTAYFWTKTAITHQPIEEVLAAFRAYNSWAKFFLDSSRYANPRQRVGAGDLATALLDAGIVSLGLKMYEYRRELWTSFATVLSTSLVFATINIFVNVAFAHVMGLQASEALAFAARNVTIALGMPAVQNLGGDGTLMGTLVVFSGMLFQMTGDLPFSWLGIRDRPLPFALNHKSDSGNDSESAPEPEANDWKVIAAGVTVGINAAAMGTAHLIERESRATAYSALSMTVFGATTVALTAVPAIADVLMKLALSQ
ncbi:hypothetical protein BJ170DRAFT_360741 [Xylariales sp. AK1849]|nr:hypothetical protein BJ170DRAFT_360741 [Xylariales sp. AK1849]